MVSSSIIQSLIFSLNRGNVVYAFVLFYTLFISFIFCVIILSWIHISPWKIPTTMRSWPFKSWCSINILACDLQSSINLKHLHHVLYIMVQNFQLYIKYQVSHTISTWLSLIIILPFQPFSYPIHVLHSHLSSQGELSYPNFIISILYKSHPFPSHITSLFLFKKKILF